MAEFRARMPQKAMIDDWACVSTLEPNDSLLGQWLGLLKSGHHLLENFNKVANSPWRPFRE